MQISLSPSLKGSMEHTRKKEHIIIHERWSKDENGVGTLIEKYYINPNGDRTYLPILPHQEIQFVKFNKKD